MFLDLDHIDHGFLCASWNLCIKMIHAIYTSIIITGSKVNSFIFIFPISDINFGPSPRANAF